MTCGLTGSRWPGILESAMADPQPTADGTSIGTSSGTGRRELSWRRKLVFGLIPATVLFGGTELVLRLLGVPEAKYLAERYEFPPKSKFGRGYVRDAAAFWRLRPGYNELWGSYKVAYSHEWMGNKVSAEDKRRRGMNFPDNDYYTTVRWEINEHGCRGPAPRAGRKIVLFMGSSVTFGWGVRHRDSFAGLIRAKFEGGGGAWDVVNAGVPNYTSYQSLATLHELVERWKPAVIVFECGINGGLPSSGARDSEFAMADRGVIPSSVIRSSNTLLALQQWFRGSSLSKTPLTEPGKKRFFRTRLYDPKKSRVTEAEFHQDLETVVQLATDKGAKVFFLFPGLYNEYGKKKLRKSANLTHALEIDMCSALQAKAADGFADLFVPYDEAHLSRRGHRVIAEAIWQRFTKELVIPR